MTQLLADPSHVRHDGSHETHFPFERNSCSLHDVQVVALFSHVWHEESQVRHVPAALKKYPSLHSEQSFAAVPSHDLHVSWHCTHFPSLR